MSEVDPDENYTAGTPVYGTNDAGLTAEITNTHENEKTSITVTKKWNDANDQDGMRPDEITLNLLADDKETGTKKTINKKTINKDNNAQDANTWTYTFEDLDVYENGNKIEYSVTETITGDAKEAYEVKIDGDAEKGITITNTHTPEVVSIPVKKIWDDNDNREKKRPDSITVALKVRPAKSEEPFKPAKDKDGNDIQVTLNENHASQDDKNVWTYEFVDLPKYEVGKVGVLNEYIVEETAVPEGYDVSYDEETHTVITNTEKTKKVLISKVDEKKKPLKGATLVLKKKDAPKDEEPIEIWKTTTEMKEFQLEPGTYILREKTPPAGYQLANPIEFTVLPNGNVEIGKKKAPGLKDEAFVGLEVFNTVQMVDRLNPPGGGGEEGGGGEDPHTPTPKPTPEPNPTPKPTPGTVPVTVPGGNTVAPTAPDVPKSGKTGVAPKTGDDAMTVLWGILMLAAAGSAAGWFILRKKEKEEQ